MVLHVGDAVKVKPEYLEKGEANRVSVVVDAWEDARGEVITIVDADQVARRERGELGIVPQFTTSADYYEKVV